MSSQPPPTDPELLKKLVLGQLPSAQADQLATECSDDSRIAELAESLPAAGDTVMGLLPHQDTLVNSDDELLVQRLQQRLKTALSIPPAAATAALGPSASPPAPAVRSLPARLEYYQPLSVLGQGGMGTVYLALDTRLGREVALKTLRPDQAADPQSKERFLREARAAAKLSHDHLVPIFYVGEADGIPFLAMPLLKGQTVESLMRQTAGPLPIEQTLRIAREAAAGLAAAHDAGLIHRDIKPSNLWLEAPGGRVKVLDFGLAKASGTGSDANDETHLTSCGTVVGTPAYMAPEQARGQTLDGRADLFSLGCVLYEALTGVRPFAGPDTMAILMNLAMHTPPAPHTVNTQCPPAFSRLVMQLLEKDPAARPASAHAVMDALTEIERKPVVVDTTVLPSQRVPSPADVPPRDVRLSLDAPAGPPSRSLSRQMMMAFAGAMTVLLAFAIYRVQTDQGTLIVQIEDSAVQAVLEKNGLILRDKDSNRTWTITAAEKKPLPCGKYQVEGQPNLHLTVTDDSGLELTTDTFTLKRKGEVRVKVSMETSAEVAITKTSPAGSDLVPRIAESVSASPPLPTRKPDVERPFALIRQGKEFRSFKSLEGVLAELKPNDLIELRGNTPLKIAGQEIIDKALDIRASEGFRPTLDLQGTVSVVGGSLRIHGCDIICQAQQHNLYGGRGNQLGLAGPWEFQNCRFWHKGAIRYFGGPGIKFKDSLILCEYGLAMFPDGICSLENCVLAGTSCVLSGAGSTFQLRNCTVSANLLAAHEGPMEKPLKLDVEGSIIGASFMPADEATWKRGLPKTIEWTGKNNCYGASAVLTAENKIVAEGLAAWEAYIGRKEPGSRVFDWHDFHMEAYRTIDQSLDEALAFYRQETERSRQSTGIEDLGPDVSLLGPGEPYLQAMKLAGKSVSGDDLRPEVVFGGPFTLLHGGVARGFASLQEAVTAAVDGDIVEIRSDAEFEQTHLEGSARKLVIRGAAGYLPVNRHGIHLKGLEEVTIENLCVRDGMVRSHPFDEVAYKFPAKGSIARVANCAFIPGMYVQHRFVSSDGAVPEIVNSIGGFHAGLQQGGTVSITNCTGTGVRVDVEDASACTVRVDRCLWFNSHLGHDSACWWLRSLSDREDTLTAHVTRTVQDVLSPSQFNLSGRSDQDFSWKGSRNLYRSPWGWANFTRRKTEPQGSFFPMNLADWQGLWQSDLDSVEQPPRYFDPRGWRPLPNGAGYRTHDGRDCGPDLDRILSPSQTNPVQGKSPPQPSDTVPLADRKLPFVRISPTGEIRGEHRFANEAFAVLQKDDILEVHGNGPFKVGQISRSNSSLHIRAGTGYRPRFVVGFEIPAEARKFQAGVVIWFGLDNVDLTITGCDFIGETSESVYQFAGSGKNWTIEDCRMIQPVGNWGAIFMFQGDSLTVRDSLLSIERSTIANVPAVPRVHFERNVLLASTVVGLDAGVSQSVMLQENTIVSANVAVVSKTANEGDHPVVDAQKNLFISTMGGMILSYGESAPHPNPKLTWKGSGNRFLPLQSGYLWSRPVAEGEASSGLKTVDEWNAYWKTPDNLKQIETVHFQWDLFNDTDWTTVRERIGNEIATARQRFSKLPHLGPEMARVGSGSGYDETLRAAQTEPFPLRAEAPEGGPFVLIRNGQLVEGYVSTTTALEHAQDGDIIEIRSDGLFPTIQVQYPYQPRLTIRAGAGYRPSFGGFDVHVSSGEWTLEGLHFRGKTGTPTIWCCARRIVNCSVDAVELDGRIQLTAPVKSDRPIEIVNCYFPTTLVLIGPKARLENSLLAAVNPLPSEESQLEVVHCAIGHHSSRHPLAGVAFGNTDKVHIHCIDTLLDAGVLTSVVQSTWHGERNLYRFGGRQWPPILTGKDTYKSIFSLADWQQHWKSDVDSRENDSILFQKALWSEVDPSSESR